jgi:hypothetical protein
MQSSRRRLEDPSVHRRIRATLLAVVTVVLLAVPAHAAPRDTAANKKIDEAVNQHYLATAFDKAENILTGTIKACEDKCSGPVLGRAWMYVGIVRGSGKGNQKGAREAFAQALAADPSVKLDDALATPDTKKSFEEAGGGAGPAPVPGVPPPEEDSKKPPPGEAPDVPGDMECTPDVFEVETRRPIPVSCSTDEDATRAELFYKEFAGEKWVTVKMRKKEDSFQAEIPCTATMNAGKLRLYVRAKAANGEDADNWGTRKKPVEINIVAQSDFEAPSYPDADPPNRCPEEVECPPDFPGCKPDGGKKKLPFGASCSEQNCETGLLCMSGLCETAPSCESDKDCPGDAQCMGGTCGVEGSEDGDGGGPAGPYKKNWVGLHFAPDFAIVGGDDVCSVASQRDNGFACFNSEDASPYPFAETPQDTRPGQNNRIATGFSEFGATSMRIMASYDRALMPNLTLGARAGFAFNGGPPANGKAFLPIHAEGRAQYFFGKDPLAKKGLRPYVHAGGGMAQVDAKLKVKATDCGGVIDPSSNRNPGPANQAEFAECMNPDATPIADHVELNLDAYKKLGTGFVTLGGGAVYAITPKFGLQLNVNLMMMLGSSGFVIQPSLGGVYGL